LLENIERRKVPPEEKYQRRLRGLYPHLSVPHAYRGEKIYRKSDTEKYIIVLPQRNIRRERMKSRRRKACYRES
jgi:hypothetical protein